MAPITKYKREQIVKKVDKFLKSKTIDDLSENELEYVAKSLLLDEIKDELKGEIQRVNIDIKKIREDWLETKRQKSEKTRLSYSKSLDVFFDWMAINGKDIFSITAPDADAFIRYLIKQEHKNATVRNRVAAVSSFFAYLTRADILKKNYFKGCELPKRPPGTKTSDEIPNDSDMDIIENALQEEFHATGRGSVGKQRQAQNLLVAVTLIKHHGFRISGVVNIQIDRSGKFKTITKGEEFIGELHPEVLKFFREFHINPKKPFDITEETFIKSFERFCKRLVRDGKISTVYSLHDLRHYAAVKFYERTKDIIATQRFLGHASVAVTQDYLISLRLKVH